MLQVELVRSNARDGATLGFYSLFIIFCNTILYLVFRYIKL